MSADLQALEPREHDPSPPTTAEPAQSSTRDEEADGEEEDDENEEDEEPKLKYAKLTGSLANVYRNGDSTSAFTVSCDKMVIGTHNGNVHVLSLPSLQPLRTYHAHSATITSVSVSPAIAVQSYVRQQDAPTPLPPRLQDRSMSTQSSATLTTFKSSPASRTPQARPSQPTVSNAPSNQIWIATSSLDGHVCVQSLIDQKDVTLRNFARPVSTVALSPDYNNDRTYLSGGLAGQLIVTQGGEKGKEQDANTNSAAAAASGWLGSMGLGTSSGSDRVLHSGEGSISCIKWSLSGKWVVWVNEEGIKIMRSHLKLGSDEGDDAWRRIAHAAKPNRKSWQDMSGVWKARAEWVDDKQLEHDEEGSKKKDAMANGAAATSVNGTVKSTASAKKPRKEERLVVGWGDTAWILHVHTGAGFSMSSGSKQIGSADIVHKLQFRDCILSGISLYTPSLLAILAYRTRDDDDRLISGPATSDDTPKKGRQHRHTSLAPQLRLVNVADGEEIDVDELPISRFETLSAQDYHLSTLYIPPPPPAKLSAEQQQTGRGALEAVWAASGGEYASRMFTSSASVMSGSSSGRDATSEQNGAQGSFASRQPGSVTPTPPRQPRPVVEGHPFATSTGLKLFIQSPYDCALAVKRDLSDHLEWLVEHEKHAQAWTLIDEHPEVVDVSSADRHSFSSQPSTPSRAGHGSLADFFADDSASATTLSATAHAQSAAAEKEKRRIGDLWLQQLVADRKWEEAGKVAGKVLGTSTRWEHWVWTFAQADRFDEITPYVPSTAHAGEDGSAESVLPSLVYEMVLGHYIQKDVPRLRDLLEQWDPALFDVRSVITAIENRLESHEVDEDTTEDGIPGRDWRVLVESLARLYLAAGRDREALKCYIRAQNADAAMALIKDGNLLDAVADDIPGFLLLRISKGQFRNAPLSELEEASSEAVKVLVQEAHRGAIPPSTVIRQLERRGPQSQPFLFFYMRQLWHGPALDRDENIPRRKFNLQIEESHAMVEDHADLAVQLFAEYDRELLMTLLRASPVYNFEKAIQICEHRHYISELVYILGKTGQTKRALNLIIGELGDVKQAIEFAKENGELWDDLLDYSMNKPRFIRGLLEEVGTAIDPIQLVRRIPEGLEIEGLKDGVVKMMREYDIQKSISEGVAKVLRGEVAMGMDTLRAGQKKAVRFEVVRESETDVDLAVHDVPSKLEPGKEILPVAKRKVETKHVKPGHCVGCGGGFHEEGKPSREILIEVCSY